MRWFLLALLAGCVHSVPPTLKPTATVTYRTPDGWTNGLRRYQADGPPVLLVHGLGANHYNWDYREEVSLAAWLQAHGWDVWVVELRGDPGTSHPDRKAIRTVTFDDFAELDLPAAVDEVLARTGHDQLYWVGHSMGGMLLYSYLAQQPEDVAAGVAICSPATLQHPLKGHKAARSLAWTMKGKGVLHARTLASLTRPLARANPFYGRVGNRDNYEWPVVHGLAKHALVDLPKPLLQQAVSWYDARDFIDLEGRPWVKAADVPLLVFGAADDKIVAHQDAEYACSVFSDCRYHLLSTETGFSVDYGHIDPVVGRTAPREVYPLVSDFLAEQRAARAQIPSEAPDAPLE